MAKIIGSTSFRHPKLLLSSTQAYDSVELTVNGVIDSPLAVTSSWDSNLLDNSVEENSVQVVGVSPVFTNDVQPGIGTNSLSVQTAQYLRLTKEIQNLPECTIRFWVKLDTVDTTTSFPVVSGEVTSYLDMEIKNHRVVKIFGAAIPETTEHFTSITPTWSCVVAILKAGVGYLYVDGVLMWSDVITLPQSVTKVVLFGNSGFTSLPAKVSDFIICSKALYELPVVPVPGVDTISIPTAPTPVDGANYAFMRLMLPFYETPSSSAVDNLSVDPTTMTRVYLAKFKNVGVEVATATLTISIIDPVPRAAIEFVDYRLVVAGEADVQKEVVGNNIEFEPLPSYDPFYSSVVLVNPYQSGAPEWRAVLKLHIKSNVDLSAAHVVKQDGASWTSLGTPSLVSSSGGIFTYEFDVPPWPTTFDPTWDPAWAVEDPVYAIQLADNSTVSAFKTRLFVQQLM